jgi:hypothetical protein
MTRERIYIETMQRILTHSKKVIVDSKSVNAPIILPPDLFRSSAPPAPPEQQAQPSPGQDQGTTQGQDSQGQGSPQ